MGCLYSERLNKDHTQGRCQERSGPVSLPVDLLEKTGFLEKINKRQCEKIKDSLGLKPL